MKQLIITSDDFGLSSGVNRAVEKAWQEGILTCASIMPTGKAFKEAVEIAHRNPGLQVGLHLTLVQGTSVLLQGDIPGLIDWKRRFTDNPVAAGMSYFFNKKLHQPLKNEIEAQIKKVIDAGINLTHIDGHLNIHQHPTVFAILTELMPAYGITSFRLSRERLKHNLQFNRERILGKSIESFIFGALSANCLPRLEKLGIRHAAEVKGVLNSGRMTEEYLLNILDGLEDGLTEIYFHPGILPDAEITRRMPDYRHEEELAALLSPAARKKLASLGIELVNYRMDRKNNA
jgi:hopanoid biosynthesis associated protein HpnK